RGVDEMSEIPSWHLLPFAASTATSGRGSPFHSLASLRLKESLRRLPTITAIWYWFMMISFNVTDELKLHNCWFSQFHLVVTPT
ncbi:MAG: hypothetical protein ABL869_12775, partial [Candidatus Nitrotoga sp.]